MKLKNIQFVLDPLFSESVNSLRLHEMGFSKYANGFPRQDKLGNFFSSPKLSLFLKCSRDIANADPSFVYLVRLALFCWKEIYVFAVSYKV